MSQRVRKAVFPVAGIGSRFLPATKSTPKEMLPIVDKPLIHYAVEEAIAAGITELIFVTSLHKRAIEDYFDDNFELNHRLAAAGKEEMLGKVAGILPENVSCTYIRQPEPLGLGHAILCAAPLVGNEPFAVLLADDLIDGKGVPVLKQMVDLHAEQSCNILAVQAVTTEQVSSYGIVDVDAAQQVVGMVEKPKPEDAPSNLAVIGRYILDGAIFDQLRLTLPGAGGEIQLTDAIAKVLATQPTLAYAFQGVRYDCGSKLGYLQATIEYAKRHPELGPAFSEWGQSLSEQS